MMAQLILVGFPRRKRQEQFRKTHKGTNTNSKSQPRQLRTKYKRSGFRFFQFQNQTSWQEQKCSLEDLAMQLLFLLLIAFSISGWDSRLAKLARNTTSLIQPFMLSNQKTKMPTSSTVFRSSGPYFSFLVSVS